MTTNQNKNTPKQPQNLFNLKPYHFQTWFRSVCCKNVQIIHVFNLLCEHWLYKSGNFELTNLQPGLSPLCDCTGCYVCNSSQILSVETQQTQQLQLTSMVSLRVSASARTKEWGWTTSTFWMTVCGRWSPSNSTVCVCVCVLSDSVHVVPMFSLYRVMDGIVHKAPQHFTLGAAVQQHRACWVKGRRWGVGGHHSWPAHSMVMYFTI